MAQTETQLQCFPNLRTALIWDNEETIRICARNIDDKTEAEAQRALELACGLAKFEKPTPWYYIHKHIALFFTNLWMRFFRKKALKALLIEDFVPLSRETTDYCKPIVADLLKKYSQSSKEEDKKTCSRLVLTAEIERWDDLVKAYPQFVFKPEGPPQTAPISEQDTKPSAPPSSPPTAPKPEPEAGSSSTVIVVPDIEPYNGKPHNPKFSTRTATSHYLDISKFD